MKVMVNRADNGMMAPNMVVETESGIKVNLPYTVEDSQHVKSSVINEKAAQVASEYERAIKHG